MRLDPVREPGYPAALSRWVGIHVSCFPAVQIHDHARYLGVEIGPGAAGHRCTKARNNFVGKCARIRSSSQSLVQRFDSFKICALSVLSFIGSVTEPDAATIMAENHALQRFRQALSTLSRPRCSDEEVHAASKLMLTIFSLRAKPLVFVLLPDPRYCQQEWRA